MSRRGRRPVSGLVHGAALVLELVEQLVLRDSEASLGGRDRCLADDGLEIEAAATEARRVVGNERRLLGTQAA